LYLQFLGESPWRTHLFIRRSFSYLGEGDLSKDFDWKLSLAVGCWSNLMAFLLKFIDWVFSIYLLRFPFLCSSDSF
jgi:hypothetical protein